MKPVPFAEYLARQQQPLAVEPSPVWPPPRKKSADEPSARMSPLLRKVEKPQPQEQRAASSQKLEQSLLKAFEEGREAARADLDDERARIKQEVAEEVARQRECWFQDMGEKMLEAQRAAFAAIETRVAQSVANILRPFLTQAIILRVTESLVENLEVLFAARTQALFEISGPADLLEALKAKFAERDAAISFTPNGEIDVRVRVDDTIIETQLASWMQALGALAPEAGQESAR